MTKAVRQIKRIIKHMRETANLCSSSTRLKLILRRIAFGNNEETTVLKVWSSILNKNRQRSKCASGNDCKLLLMRGSIFFESGVNSMGMFKAKLFHKGIDSVNLLADRINIGSMTTRSNGQRNARETSSRTHIEKIALWCLLDIRKQDKRIYDVQNHTLIKVKNPCEVGCLISLNHQVKMLKTKLKLLLGNRQLIFLTKRNKALKHLSDLFIRNVLHERTSVSMTKVSVSRSFGKKRGRGKPRPQTKISKELLASNNHHMALRVNAFGVRLDRIIATKSDMNKATLIGVHRRKRHALMGTDRTLGSRLGH